jgi:tRNA uridine 5-carboxymethylaminomethyl modification enzyme
LLAPLLGEETAEVVEQVEVEVKYEGYIRKQVAEVQRARRFERLRLPADLDYEGVVGLRTEARQKLARILPATLGQAARIYGVTPADVAVLLTFLEKRRRSPRGCAEVVRSFRPEVGDGEEPTPLTPSR